MTSSWLIRLSSYQAHTETHVYGDVMIWKCLPHYRPSVVGIHGLPVDFHKWPATQCNDCLRITSCWAPSHYLNRCWLINWTIKTQFEFGWRFQHVLLKNAIAHLFFNRGSFFIKHQLGNFLCMMIKIQKLRWQVNHHAVFILYSFTDPLTENWYHTSKTEINTLNPLIWNAP